MIIRTSVAAKPRVGINGKTSCRVTKTPPRPPAEAQVEPAAPAREEGPNPCLRCGLNLQVLNLQVLQGPIQPHQVLPITPHVRRLPLAAGSRARTLVAAQPGIQQAHVDVARLPA